MPATAFNLAVKDGQASGQPVPHLHVHVAPRWPNDLSPDKIYDLIDRWSPEGPPNVPPPFDIPSDNVRAARSEGSMAEESRRYGALVAGMEGLTGAAAAFDAPVQFGKFALAPTQVFYVSASGGTYATVNLKPLCPGHVLVIPKRVVPLLAELSEFWLSDQYADRLSDPLVKHTRRLNHYQMKGRSCAEPRSLPSL